MAQGRAGQMSSGRGAGICRKTDLGASEAHWLAPPSWEGASAKLPGKRTPSTPWAASAATCGTGHFPLSTAPITARRRGDA
jgi:hypothetical protein